MRLCVSFLAFLRTSASVTLFLPVCLLFSQLPSYETLSLLVAHPPNNPSLQLIYRGSLDVKMAPKAVTLREETELQAMLDRLALDQEDVDGDEPEDN